MSWFFLEIFLIYWAAFKLFPINNYTDQFFTKKIKVSQHRGDARQILYTVYFSLTAKARISVLLEVLLPL